MPRLAPVSLTRQEAGSHLLQVCSPPTYCCNIYFLSCGVRARRRHSRTKFNELTGNFRRKRREAQPTIASKQLKHSCYVLAWRYETAAVAPVDKKSDRGCIWLETHHCYGIG